MSIIIRLNNQTMDLIHYGSGDNVAGNKLTYYGKPARRLDDRLKSQMLNHIPKNSTVRLNYVMNDPEAFAFASEIKVFIENAGMNYQVDGFNSVIRNKPLAGHDLVLPDPTRNYYLLDIGTNT